MPGERRVPTGRRRRGLATRIAVWIGLSTAASVPCSPSSRTRSSSSRRPESTTDPEEDVAAEAGLEVGTSVLVAAPIAIALAMVSAVVLTRRALRPLDDVMRAAGALTAHELDRRLPMPRADDEVRALVVA